MRTFPLEYLTLDEAKRLQFKLVDTNTRHFTGVEFLSMGDSGMVPGIGRSRTTAKVEKVIAEFIGAHDG